MPEVDMAFEQIYVPEWHHREAYLKGEIMVGWYRSSSQDIWHLNCILKTIFSIFISFNGNGAWICDCFICKFRTYCFIDVLQRYNFSCNSCSALQPIFIAVLFLWFCRGSRTCPRGRKGYECIAVITCSCRHRLTPSLRWLGVLDEETVMLVLMQQSLEKVNIASYFLLAD